MRPSRVTGIVSGYPFTRLSLYFAPGVVPAHGKPRVVIPTSARNADGSEPGCITFPPPVTVPVVFLTLCAGDKYTSKFGKLPELWQQAGRREPLNEPRW
jgi:hypothetical protein